MEKGAIISKCGMYRYSLWRIMDKANSKPGVLFIGLNPSTADECLDDPTIRRCIDFAERWGYGHMFMMNAFAYRSKEPNVLSMVADPVGPENDQYLQEAAAMGYDVVLCWGVRGAMDGRGAQVAAIFPLAKCFGVTENGQPRHPLYLPKNSKLMPYVLSKGPDTLGEDWQYQALLKHTAGDIGVLGIPTVD